MFTAGCSHIIRKDDQNFIRKDGKVPKKRIDYWLPARSI